MPRGPSQPGDQPGFALLVDAMPPPLEGELIETTHWEDAHHWMSIYADLIDFKVGILDQVRRDLSKLVPVAQRAAEADVEIIENQMEGYQVRFDLWSRRVRDLHGLWLDSDRQVILYKDRQAHLTAREFQLVRFLLNHPHRSFTVTQILDKAWAGNALFPEEVRNYVSRVRKVLRSLEAPCDVISRPGRGYSLVFRSQMQ
jgi:hypothetical protein